MSLKVSGELIEQAQCGELDDADFLACVKESLPYAWSVVKTSVDRLKSNGAVFVDDGSVPPNDQAWGELLRFAASDAMRGAVERYFGVRLAFQNCCRIGVFDPAAVDERAEFTSSRAQVLNQKPELLNC